VPKNILSSFVHASTIHSASLAKNYIMHRWSTSISAAACNCHRTPKKGLTRKELHRSIRRAELLDFLWELFLLIGLMEDDVLEHVSP
jgi:hypothetical protein